MDAKTKYLGSKYAERYCERDDPLEKKRLEAS